MKVAVALSGLLLLVVVDYCTANCVTPWVEVDGQCMVCSINPGFVAGPSSYAAAQSTCEGGGGDLATITSTTQHNWIRDNCGATPYIGYTNSPIPMFNNGDSAANAAATVGITIDINPDALAPDTTLPDCYHLVGGVWREENTNCLTVRGFSCSKPLMTCPNLDATGFEPIAYLTPAGVAGPVAGPQCVASTATYACPTGFEISGNNPRTCGTDESWSGTRPTCVHVGICTDLTEPDNAGITYSAAAHTNGMRIIGTAAIQMCVEDYEMTSGSGPAIRTCMAGGSWSASAIACQKDNDNALAIGLGVGLGVLALIGLLMAVLCCCCRPMGGGARPVPVPVPRPGYPRPRPVIRPYPRRIGRRPGYPY